MTLVALAFRSLGCPQTWGQDEKTRHKKEPDTDVTGTTRWWQSIPESGWEIRFSTIFHFVPLCSTRCDGKTQYNDAAPWASRLFIVQVIYIHR
ncbi:MAG: hypothetical protein HQL37_08790 [Alphaproteobacteria bacterium]|nr:hypothetical protein [Alphaproteobacteria bacterium]